MKLKKVLKQIEGMQTIKSIMTLLDITKPAAIQLIYRLRKEGYVNTNRTNDKTRVYDISYENKLKGTNYYDLINKYSPIKIAARQKYIIYGKNPTLEEVLIFALKTKSVRTIIAAMALFRYIKDWPKLYRLSKNNYLERQTGALYDVMKKITKIRKMTKRFRNNALPKQNYSFCFVIDNLKSNDFKDIEKIWRVYLPFNKQDLEVYR